MKLLQKLPKFLRLTLAFLAIWAFFGVVQESFALTCNTTYYYVADSESSGGKTTSAEKTVTTAACGTTSPAANANATVTTATKVKIPTTKTATTSTAAAAVAAANPVLSAINLNQTSVTQELSPEQLAVETTSAPAGRQTENATVDNTLNDLFSEIISNSSSGGPSAYANIPLNAVATCTKPCNVNELIDQYRPPNNLVERVNDALDSIGNILQDEKPAECFPSSAPLLKKILVVNVPECGSYNDVVDAIPPPPCVPGPDQIVIAPENDPNNNRRICLENPCVPPLKLKGARWGTKSSIKCVKHDDGISGGSGETNDGSGVTSEGGGTGDTTDGSGSGDSGDAGGDVVDIIIETDEGDQQDTGGGCPIGLRYDGQSESCVFPDPTGGDCATKGEFEIGAHVSKGQSEKIKSWIERFFQPCADDGSGGGNGGDECPPGTLRTPNGLCSSGDDTPDCYTQETQEAYGGIGSMISILNKLPLKCADDGGGGGSGGGTGEETCATGGICIDDIGDSGDGDGGGDDFEDVECPAETGKTGIRVKIRKGDTSGLIGICTEGPGDIDDGDDSGGEDCVPSYVNNYCKDIEEIDCFIYDDQGNVVGTFKGSYPFGCGDQIPKCRGGRHIPISKYRDKLYGELGISPGTITYGERFALSYVIVEPQELLGYKIYYNIEYSFNNGSRIKDEVRLWDQKSGTVFHSPYQGVGEYTYYLVASDECNNSIDLANATGKLSDPTFEKPPIVFYTSTGAEIEQTINKGETLRLYWHTQNADSVQLADHLGNVISTEHSNLKIGEPVSPQFTTIYEVKAENQFGENSKKIKINVIENKKECQPGITELRFNAHQVFENKNGGYDVILSLFSTASYDDTTLRVTFDGSDPRQGLKVPLKKDYTVLLNINQDSTLRAFAQANFGCDISLTKEFGPVNFVVRKIDCLSFTTSIITPKHAHASADPTVEITAGEQITLGSHISGSNNASIPIIDGYIRSSPDQPNLYKIIQYSVENDPAGHRFIATDGDDFLAPNTKITKPTLVNYKVNPISSNICSDTAALRTVTILVKPLAQGETPAPTGSITASATEVNSGESVTVNWTSQDSASTEVLHQFSGTISREVKGSYSEKVTRDTTYTLKLVHKKTGDAFTKSVTVKIKGAPEPPPKPTVEIKANGVIDHLVVGIGDTAKLTWSSTSATNCAATGDWSGVKSIAGEEQTGKHFIGTKTYILSCEGPGGSAAYSVKITARIIPPAAPTITLTGSETIIPPGEGHGQFTLSWTSTNATRITLRSEVPCSAEGGELTPPASGSINVSFTNYQNPLDPCHYQAFAQGPGGSVLSKVVKIDPPPASTITLSASPTEVEAGGSFKLTWQSTQTISAALHVVEGFGVVPCPGHGQPLEPTAGGLVTLTFPSSGQEYCKYRAFALGAGAKAYSNVITVSKKGTPPTEEGIGKAEAPLEIAVKPEPKKGKYGKNDKVEISITASKPKATILYTLDGTAPSLTGLTTSIYSKPIIISKTTVLQAMGLFNKEETAVKKFVYEFDDSQPLVDAISGLKVQADPAGGKFKDKESVLVKLTHQPISRKLDIHYTIGGAEPTRNSPKYKEPLYITNKDPENPVILTIKGFGSETEKATYLFNFEKTDTSKASTFFVAASPTGKTYQGPVTVSLAASGGSGASTIYYTTNGSQPTDQSTKYSGPITISSSVTLQFMAIDSTGAKSAVGREQYSIASQGSPTTITWETPAPAQKQTDSTIITVPTPTSYVIKCNGEEIGTTPSSNFTDTTVREEPCNYTATPVSPDGSQQQEVDAVTAVVSGENIAAAVKNLEIKPLPTPVQQTVEKVDNVVVPVAVVTTVAATAAAATPATAQAAFNFFALAPHIGLLSIFTRRRRRNPWGQIVDATTDLPIKGALVSLIDPVFGRTVTSQVTDLDGRFMVFAQASGSYKLSIRAQGYQGVLSQPFDIGPETPPPNISAVRLSPLREIEISRAHKLASKLLAISERVRVPILLVGSVFMLISLAQTEFGVASIVEIVVYALLWLAEVWLRRRPRPWGVVIDAQTHKPVERAIIRLIDRAHRQLVATVVTGSNGKFSFLAPKGDFSLIVIQNQYLPYRLDHLVLAGRNSLVNQSIPMQKRPSATVNLAQVVSQPDNRV